MNSFQGDMKVKTDEIDIKTIEEISGEMNRSSHTLILTREEIIENTKLLIEINLKEEILKFINMEDNKGLKIVKGFTCALKKRLETFCLEHPSVIETNHLQLSTSFSIATSISTYHTNSTSTVTSNRIRRIENNHNNYYDQNQLSKVFIFRNSYLLQLDHSNDIIVNALYESRRVKVKLSMCELSLRNEYDVMQLLYRQENHLFIRPYNFLCGSKGEICSMKDHNYEYDDDDNNDNNFDKYLPFAYAIVMEYGNNYFNLHHYICNNYNKNDFYHNFKTIGYHITEILKITHENNIILMDLQPLNILRVLSNETSSIHHKYFYHCHPINLNKYHHHQFSSFSNLYSSVSKYISPEIARIILISNEQYNPHRHHHHHYHHQYHKQQQQQQQQAAIYAFQPTTAIDIFAFGLLVFEIYNNNISLWEELNVDISNIDDILMCASSLTDNQISNQIYKCFHDYQSIHIRGWLLSALKVNPKDRASIHQLDTRHDLFNMQYSTTNHVVDSMIEASTSSVVTTTASMMLLNTERIIHAIETNTQHVIDNSNTNRFVIINRFQELRHEIQCEFYNLHAIFNAISDKCIHGNWKYIESLDNLKLQLELQRNQNRLDIDAIHHSFHNMSYELSSKLDQSISSILFTSSKGDISSSSLITEDINRRLQLLIEMVSNVKEHVSTCMKYSSDIRRLTSKIVKSLNRYPCTFIIFPKSVIDKQLNNNNEASSSSFLPFSSSFLPILNTLTKHIIDPLNAFLWEKSRLFFLCPISMQIVRCGPHGVGYNIRIPSASLRMIVPVLKWGILFLKAGLATQGLGKAIPDLASFLPVIDDNYINNIEKVIILCSQPTLINTINNLNNFDQIFNQTLDSITEEQDQHAYNFLADLLMKKEKYLGNNIHTWEPKDTGLIKEISPFDGSCMWISKESKQEFVDKGMNAIRMK